MCCTRRSSRSTGRSMSSSATTKRFPRIPNSLARLFLAETTSYWQDWVRDLNVPFDWQDAVIRAAITLKLCSFDDTGAIVAALTTSVPEAAGSSRNWDYRFCWLRDAFFTVTALNRLSATRTMEAFVRFVLDSLQRDDQAPISPAARGRPRHGSERTHRRVACRISWDRTRPHRQRRRARSVKTTCTDRSCSPRRRCSGINGCRCRATSASTGSSAKSDARRQQRRSSPMPDFGSIATVRASTRSPQRCAGPHCIAWATSLATWASSRTRNRGWIRRPSCGSRFSTARRFPSEGWLSGALDSAVADASTLVLPEIGFISSHDERFVRTLEVVEKRLVRNGFVMRYDEADDFGLPENAFLLCTFWYIDALARAGRRKEARALFENMLSCCNHVGLAVGRCRSQDRENCGEIFRKPIRRSDSSSPRCAFPEHGKKDCGTRCDRHGTLTCADRSPHCDQEFLANTAARPVLMPSAAAISAGHEAAIR